MAALLLAAFACVLIVRAPHAAPVRLALRKKSCALRRRPFVASLSFFRMAALLLAALLLRKVAIRYTV